MNKWQRRLALALIRAEIRRHERKAVKRMRSAKGVSGDLRANRLREQLIDGTEYRDLWWLYNNIHGINNPWQGVFAPFWKWAPTDDKHIEKFAPFVPEGSLRPDDWHKNNFEDEMGNFLTEEELDQWLAAIDKEVEESGN